MAYIKERGAYWRAEVRRKGYKPTYRTFDTQRQAQQWARRVESEMDSGKYYDQTEAEHTTLREALERYQRDIVPTKRHPYRCAPTPEQSNQHLQSDELPEVQDRLSTTRLQHRPQKPNLYVVILLDDLRLFLISRHWGRWDSIFNPSI